MCLSTPKPPAPPPVPPPPMRADEENRRAVDGQLRRVSEMSGRSATYLTGAGGDPGFGQSTRGATLLGQAGPV